MVWFCQIWIVSILRRQDFCPQNYRELSSCLLVTSSGNKVKNKRKLKCKIRFIIFTCILIFVKTGAQTTSKMDARTVISGVRKFDITIGLPLTYYNNVAEGWINSFYHWVKDCRKNVPKIVFFRKKRKEFQYIPSVWRIKSTIAFKYLKAFQHSQNNLKKWVKLTCA